MNSNAKHECRHFAYLYPIPSSQKHRLPSWLYHSVSSIKSLVPNSKAIRPSVPRYVQITHSHNELNMVIEMGSLTNDDWLPWLHRVDELQEWMIDGNKLVMIIGNLMSQRIKDDNVGFAEGRYPLRYKYWPSLTTRQHDSKTKMCL